jgi:hypothetical protein
MQPKAPQNALKDVPKLKLKLPSRPKNASNATEVTKARSDSLTPPPEIPKDVLKASVAKYMASAGIVVPTRGDDPDSDSDNDSDVSLPAGVFNRGMADPDDGDAEEYHDEANGGDEREEDTSEESSDEESGMMSYSLLTPVTDSDGRALSRQVFCSCRRCG